MNKIRCIKDMQNNIRTKQISDTTRVSKRFNGFFSTGLSASMSKGKVFCLSVLILIFSLSGIVNAAIVECDSCADCTGKLNGSYDEVYLNTSYNHSGTCLTFEASNVTFDCQGNIIDGNGTGNGFYLKNNSGNIIRNCIITDFYFGIFLASSSNNTILNNTVILNGNGIYLGWSSNNTLANNTMHSNNYSGIYLDWFSSNNTMANNTLRSNNESGVYLDNSSNNNIINNTAHSNAHNGIFLYFFSNNNNLINNTAHSNNYSGIYLGWSSNNSIANNNASSNNDFGIHLYSSSNNTVTNNAANSNNQSGINLSADSSSNTINSNTFCANNQSGGAYYDIYDADANSGDNNTCDTTYHYNDSGAEGCTTPCMQALTYQIPLKVGWNLISIPFRPKNTSVKEVLASLGNDSYTSWQGNYSKVQSYINGSWKTYLPTQPPLINTLKEINESMGFWINMTQEDTLVLEDYSVSLTQRNISLRLGWNMIGYSSTKQTQPVKDALYSLGNDSYIGWQGNYSKVQSYINGSWKTYLPTQPPLINTLKNMTMGYGYWINVTSNDILEYS